MRLTVYTIKGVDTFNNVRSYKMDENHKFTFKTYESHVSETPYPTFGYVKGIIIEEERFYKDNLISSIISYLNMTECKDTRKLVNSYIDTHTSEYRYDVGLAECEVTELYNDIEAINDFIKYHDSEW